MDDFLKTLQTAIYTEAEKKSFSGNELFAEYYVKRLWKEAIGVDFYQNHRTTPQKRSCIDYLIADSASIINLTVTDDMKKRMDLVKKSLLISDLTVAHEKKGNVSKRVWGYNDSEANYSASQLDCYVNCLSNNFSDLGSFLDECKPAIINGKIFYYPTYQITFSENFYATSFNMRSDDEIVTWNEKKSAKDIAELLKYNNSLFDYYTNPIFETNDLIIIDKMELPYIENVEFSTFIDLLNNELDGRNNILKHLRSKLFELKVSANSGAMRYNLRKAGDEIKEGVDEITSLLNKTKHKRIFQISEAFIGTIIATLVAVNIDGFTNIAPFVGAGGGLFSFLKILEDFYYEKKEIKENKFFFLWLLQKNK